MNNQFKACNHCGTRCDINDKFCKVCFSTLPETEFKPVIEGIEDVELINYMGKKSDYYLEKFAKSKKKWFVQWNWAAMLFGPTWFFYRKMYKVATIYSSALILLSLLFSLVIPIAFRADIDCYFETKDSYYAYTENYNNPDGRYNIYDEPEYQDIKADYRSAQKMIKRINLLIVVPVNVLNFAFRLFGNAFYKRHITLNVHNGNNGVSMKSAIFGFVGYHIALNLVSLLLLLVPAVVRFMEAIQYV